MSANVMLLIFTCRNNCKHILNDIIHEPDVHPSVCPSVKCVDCDKTKFCPDCYTVESPLIAFHWG